MQRWQEWQTASDADWSAALKREAIIRPLAEQVRLSESAVVEAAESLGLGRVTIYRLVNRYKRRPQTSSLLPWKRGRAKNSQFLDPVREDLIAVCIKEFYLTRERPSLGALFQEVKRRFAERQLPSPNYRTVRRRVEALDARTPLDQIKPTLILNALSWLTPRNRMLSRLKSASSELWVIAGSSFHLRSVGSNSAEIYASVLYAASTPRFTLPQRSSHRCKEGSVIQDCSPGWFWTRTQYNNH